MIIFVYGTTGELIKLAPIMRRLEEGNRPFLAISTHQQATQIAPMSDDLGVRQPDLVLANGFRGRDLSRNWELPLWAAVVAWRFLTARPVLRRTLRHSPGRHLLVVHGDTVTTVLGALLGMVMRVPVAHVEAGLRSHDWRNPFPEEINRRIVGRLADVHYAPNDEAVANLEAARGSVVPTHGNTVLDSLALVPEHVPELAELVGDALPQRFGVVSIHRFELLANEERLRELLVLLRHESERTPLVFIDHPVTVTKIAQYGLDDLLDAPGVRRVPRLGYLAFIALLRRSAYLITDSGGAQEECYYLDHPCLVHRRQVERSEGLGRNVVLSQFRPEVVTRFLGDPGAVRAGERPEFGSPSDTIVADFHRRGVWGARSFAGPVRGVGSAR